MQDPIKEIFTQQKELIEKYHAIEANNGFNVLHGYPLDLNNRFAQARLKDFAWRITEELTESSSADNAGDVLKELIDALHFFVELCILSDFFPVNNWETVQLQCRPNFEDTPMFYDIIEAIGKAMNELKNRPWKQSHTETATGNYKMHLSAAWCGFIRLFKYCGVLNETMLYKLYFEKANINKMRQINGY